MHLKKGEVVSPVDFETAFWYFPSQLVENDEIQPGKDLR